MENVFVAVHDFDGVEQDDDDDVSVGDANVADTVVLVVVRRVTPPPGHLRLISPWCALSFKLPQLVFPNILPFPLLLCSGSHRCI